MRTYSIILIIFITSLSLLAFNKVQAQIVTPAGTIQGNSTNTNVGINVATPLSKLSVNGPGNNNFGIYVTSPTTGPGVAGLVAELPAISGTTDWNHGVLGRITSGRGYAVGLNGYSYNPTPSTAGRSYGVFSQAGNATSNYNYGVFSQIRGTNAGTAILGWDRINNPSWNHSTNGTWAGYFVGNVGVDGNVGVNTFNPQSKVSINGDGDARFGAYVTSSAAGAGVGGLMAELPQITGGTDWNRSLHGKITSGRGYAVGVSAYSYNNTPSTAGRSYGVYSQAGNATSNYNYAVYGQIRGNNAGTAILGWDRINNPGWNQSTNGTWAGYFVGDVEVDGKVGVNTLNPQSKVSINGDGDARYGAYVTSSTAGPGVAGLVSELPQISGATDWNRSIQAKIESGRGYAVAMNAHSYTNTPSTAGRSYGLFSTAGNATSNYNYGVFSQIRGSHAGTAILGWDRINKPSWNQSTNGTWAGYFVGDVGVDGKVAIGTTNMPTNLGGYSLANYKLYVCGGILANEFLIPNVSWCDYVFEEDYDLTPLEDVKAHIEEKGYLHKTPSAEVIESEGMKVGDVTINQQEKIEEIFLHLIEMNEELKELKAENAALKTQVEELKK